DRAYISNLEAGKQNPTLETIAEIAEALGVGSGELLK
ncbi:transcriptional regulator, partial [Candidatus Campbellbacteria bacterium CG11_big_fil_rev_8_21_14_0_20_44_21]